MVAAEDEESRPTNPRLNDSDEKGKNVDSGVTTDFAGCDNEEVTVTNLQYLSFNVKNTIHENTRTEGAGHVDIKDFNGPQLLSQDPLGLGSHKWIWVGS